MWSAKSGVHVILCVAVDVGEDVDGVGVENPTWKMWGGAVECVFVCVRARVCAREKYGGLRVVV